jgi:hypothetical protein
VIHRVATIQATHSAKGIVEWLLCTFDITNSEYSLTSLCSGYTQSYNIVRLVIRCIINSKAGDRHSNIIS